MNPVSAAPGSPNQTVTDALAGQAASLVSFLDNLADMAYMKDRDGRYLVMNAAAAKFLGKPLSDVIGHDDFELFPAEQAQRIMEQDRAVLASGESVTFEEELTGAGGSMFGQTVKSVCRDAAGAVIGLVGITREISERKHLEQALRERERQAVEAQRIAGLGTWRWERATDKVTWSDEIYEIFGRDRASQPPGHAALLRVEGPASLRELVKAFDRAVRFGEPYTMDMELQRADGTSRWIIARGEVERWENGVVASLRGTVQEITDRKRLEMALRQREHDLLEAQRIAGIGTWRFDCATRTTEWSAEIYRIYGIDPSQPAMEYDAFRRRPAHSENDIEFIERFERLLSTGEPYEMDVEVKLPDGTSRWTISRAEPERWVDGRVVSVRGTVHEITERKRHEEELALSENRYRSLVNASSQIVWIVGADGRQFENVPGWRAFTGQSEDEVKGQGFIDALHPEDRAESLRRWSESLATGEPHTMEHRVRRSDGEYRHMAVHAVPVRDRSGKIVEWVGMHTDITERKLAEEESRRAHRRLEDVMESITDGICVLDRDLRYLYFNENGARMTGFKPSEIIGKQLGDLLVENKRNAFGAAYHTALRTGNTVHFEAFYGAPLNKWFESNCYPSAQGLTVYFRDITERKRTESALRESESRYRKLFESNMMGIARPDRFGAFKDGNDELLRITGYTREELEAGLVRWDTMTPPEYAPLDAEHIAEAAARGSCTPYEKEYIRKDGSRVPILCGYALLEDSEDEYIGFIVDLTRQRAAEAGLREREQRFRLLAESLPELVWVSDRVGSLTYLNQRFLDYCGIAPEEMVGYDWRQILHPDEVHYVLERWTHTVATGEPYLIELQMRRHDGAYRHFLARAVPLRNDESGIERWVGSCTDIHDQKLAEEALRRSEKLAATGRLAASIAHEINNPLSSVMNALYLALQDTELSGETRGFLKMAEQELARVSHITTQTLRFHRQSKAAAWVDLSETMQSVLLLFGPRLLARRIELQSECDRCATICCLEDELRQVFANLVSNSLDATPDGGRLRIRIRVVNGSGGRGVRVTVGDTGCGIPAAIQKRIFEPFFSTKDTTGIGLGLWVSDGIIRKHKGVLGLRSSTGAQRHGTVFSLFLPENGIA